MGPVWLMIVKAVTLFLIGMLVLGMFGKLRLPKVPSRPKKKSVEDARKCKACGSYILGEGPCACKHKT